ncbi:MAG: hypothetical protein R6X02_27540 [Enhygromyxa sp.]
MGERSLGIVGDDGASTSTPAQAVDGSGCAARGIVETGLGSGLVKPASGLVETGLRGLVDGLVETGLRPKPEAAETGLEAAETGLRNRPKPASESSF